MTGKAVFGLALGIFLSACGGGSPDLGGTYLAAPEEGEFSVAKKQMEVAPLSDQSEDLYTIVIRSTFQRKLGPDSLGPVTQAAPIRLQGRYDSKNRVLEVKELDRSLPVDEKKGTITNLTSVFTKVSPK